MLFSYSSLYDAGVDPRTRASGLLGKPCPGEPHPRSKPACFLSHHGAQASFEFVFLLPQPPSMLCRAWGLASIALWLGLSMVLVYTCESVWKDGSKLPGQLKSSLRHHVLRRKGSWGWYCSCPSSIRTVDRGSVQGHTRAGSGSRTGRLLPLGTSVLHRSGIQGPGFHFLSVKSICRGSASPSVQWSHCASPTQPQRSLEKYVCAYMFMCVCTRSGLPLPRLPGGRKEGIFGALGSTVVGLITGFQLQAGGHALGRGCAAQKPCHFPASEGLFKGGI